jgi:hypothetical protein
MMRIPTLAVLVLGVHGMATAQVPDTTHLVPPELLQALQSSSRSAAPEADGPIHHLPVSSEGHLVELTIQNAANIAVDDVRVATTDAPDWIRLDNPEIPIRMLERGADAIARFTFAVLDHAPIGEAAEVTFSVFSGEHRLAARTIRLAADAPSEYRLDAAYPNPFNPAATISFQLREAAHVTLEAYNVIGQKVATVVDEKRDAGVYRVSWDAGRLASGTYIIRMEVDDGTGAQVVRTRTLTLLK